VNLKLINCAIIAFSVIIDCQLLAQRLRLKSGILLLVEIAKTVIIKANR